jgi:recombination protein RecR
MIKNAPLAGLPPVVHELVENMSGFPGIGKKSALRMALYVLRSERLFAQTLADSLLAVKDKIGLCETCWTLSEHDPCPICTDHHRDQSMICLVEEPGDIIALERTESWKGLYHVLGGAISPLDGIGPEQLRLQELRNRVEKNTIREIVVATNPTAEGETTALYVARMFKTSDIKITRIARGVPMGSDLELVDNNTLMQSLEGRSTI